MTLFVITLLMISYFIPSLLNSFYANGICVLALLTIKLRLFFKSDPHNFLCCLCGIRSVCSGVYGFWQSVSENMQYGSMTELLFVQGVPSDEVR